MVRRPIILPDSLRDAAGQKRVVCNPMEEDPDYVGERRCVLQHNCEQLMREFARPDMIMPSAAQCFTGLLLRAMHGT